MGSKKNYHFNEFWESEGNKNMCSSALPSNFGLFAGEFWCKLAQDEDSEDSEDTWVVAMHSGIPACDWNTMSVYPCQTSWWPKNESLIWNKKTNWHIILVQAEHDSLIYRHLHTGIYKPFNSVSPNCRLETHYPCVLFLLYVVLDIKCAINISCFYMYVHFLFVYQWTVRSFDVTFFLARNKWLNFDTFIATK